MFVTNLQQCRTQHHLPPSTNSEPPRHETILPANLVNSLHQNVNWFNEQYDKVFGIAEVRDIQNRVLKAESEFVSITQKRKSCQDKIERLKEDIKGIRDKLEITPRQSDNYLRLITQEHKLLREQLALDAQLSQFRESEQLSLDNLSKLLRQSHELERLRQERAKYWQIISISLSLVGSLVALIAQRVRSQKTIMNQLTLFDTKLLEMENSIHVIKEESQHYFKTSISRIDRLQSSLEDISQQLGKKSTRKGDKKPHEQKDRTWFSWLSWIPGLA